MDKLAQVAGCFQCSVHKQLLLFISSTTSEEIDIEGGLFPRSRGKKDSSVSKIMQVYEIEELHSGEDEQALWVSIGFISDLNDLDVLHIICTKEIDEKETNTDLEGIYFERFDQAYSCYNGAEKIAINGDSVTITFNLKGSAALEFPEKVTFQKSNEGADFQAARHIFQRMRFYPFGGIVTIE